jgi:signal transduction histidine kinase
LHAGEQHFKQLARSVWRVQEDERRRIAHELHDGVGHNITALIHLITEALAALPVASTDPEALQRLQRAQAIAESTLQDTRSLSRLLRPQILDDLGLEQALRWLARTFTETHNLDVELSIEGAVQDLDSDRCTLVFRVAQEALSNLMARGDARHVELVIEGEEGGYQMTIGDDSTAMSAEQLRALTSMRHRMLGAGGRLSVEAVPGQGNRITAYVPRSPAVSE